LIFLIRERVALRFGDFESGDFKVVIIDAGYTNTGVKLAEFVEQSYGTKTVNLAICTHPDQDHAAGFSKVVELLEVSKIWINLPTDFVINADINSTTLSWVVCNVLDPDGRNQNSDRIGFFGEMFGIGKHTPDGVLNVIFAFDNAIRMDIVQRLQNDEHLMLRVQGEVTSVNDENQLVTGPLFELDRFALTPNEGNDHPILDGVPLNNLEILVNADVRLRVVATVTGEDGVAQSWFPTT
jgi:hypothetical protein